MCSPLVVPLLVPHSPVITPVVSAQTPEAKLGVWGLVTHPQQATPLSTTVTRAGQLFAHPEQSPWLKVPRRPLWSQRPTRSIHFVSLEVFSLLGLSSQVTSANDAGFGHCGTTQYENCIADHENIQTLLRKCWTVRCSNEALWAPHELLQGLWPFIYQFC